jgi:hypothetical protein
MRRQVLRKPFVRREENVVGCAVFNLPGEHPAGAEREPDAAPAGSRKALCELSFQRSQIGSASDEERLGEQGWTGGEGTEGDESGNKMRRHT